ncbi:hypothetical protein OF83DRAFT_1180666 [Amylostereum chailletii]|nr:hypothetical protein OF83DRAFT_1180666 [Amylostereum chailletii]
MPASHGRGRPPKRKRNISNLRNQPSTQTSTPLSPQAAAGSVPEEASENDPNEEVHAETDADTDTDMDWDPAVVFDGLRIVENEDVDGMGPETEVEEVEDDDELNDEDFCQRLCELAEQMDDDPKDETWVPDWQKRKRRREREGKARPTTYCKGPDMGSKSDRTQRQH